MYTLGGHGRGVLHEQHACARAQATEPSPQVSCSAAESPDAQVIQQPKSLGWHGGALEKEHIIFVPIDADITWGMWLLRRTEVHDGDSSTGISCYYNKGGPQGDWDFLPGLMLQVFCIRSHQSEQSDVL